MKLALSPDERTHMIGRFGAVAVDVSGNLNLVKQTGRYYGGYVGIGFETQMTPNLSVGPDVSVLAIQHEAGDRVYFVPQLGWNLNVGIGGGSYCDPAIGCTQPRDLYVKVAPSIFPGLGAGLTFGQVCYRRRATWSFEITATKHAIDNDIGGAAPDSEYAQVMVGAKGSWSPSSCRHFVTRLGFCGFKATGKTNIIDEPTTYYGVYAGIGYDFDLSDRWTTGPEATVLFGIEENKDQTTVLVPQLGWHLTYWL